MDAQDLKKYMDIRLTSELFGFKNIRGNSVGEEARYGRSGGIVNILADAEVERRCKGKKSNRFVAKGKRRAKIDTAEFRDKIGKRVVDKYLERNPSIDLGLTSYIDSSFVNQIIKEELCIGKYISPQSVRDQAHKEVRKYAMKLGDEFDKLRTAIICGAVDDPLTELREFKKYVEGGTWLT